LQIDPYSAEAHAALAYVRHYEWQWAEAEREFRRAIEMNPSYPYAHLWYANLLMSRRRLDEALQQVKLAQELDPFSLIVNSNVAWVLTNAGRNAEAITQLRQTLTLDSTYVQAHMRLIGPLEALGRFDEARREAEIAVRLTNGSMSAAAALAATTPRRDGRPTRGVSWPDSWSVRARSTYRPVRWRSSTLNSATRSTRTSG
jgi:tetratricopeptide (TPR) repeat protein